MFNYYNKPKNVVIYPDGTTASKDFAYINLAIAM